MQLHASGKTLVSRSRSGNRRWPPARQEAGLADTAAGSARIDTVRAIAGPAVLVVLFRSSSCQCSNPRPVNRRQAAIRMSARRARIRQLLFTRDVLSPGDVNSREFPNPSASCSNLRPVPPRYAGGDVASGSNPNISSNQSSRLPCPRWHPISHKEGIRRKLRQ